MDLSLLNPVLHPLFPCLLPNSTQSFHLSNRVQMLTTMVEGKVLHNSPQADLPYAELDRQLNKWLGAICGLRINGTSASFLRCELGVLPSRLVGERNAMYFLWHLTHESWFRRFLPHLEHLPPLARLTCLPLDYNLTLEDLRECTSAQQWKKMVKDAVLARAQTWYSSCEATDRLNNSGFAYLGRQYMHHDDLGDLAEVAIQMRADRLHGVPNYWEHHPCPFCDVHGGLHGAHLLQCEQLPTNLTTEREQLRLEMGAGYTVTALAIRILTCDPAFSDAKFLRTGLLFARKVFQAARKLLNTTAPPTPTSDQGADAFFDDSP
jgi:hypothetical protein